jgi:preprotein translocase subunit SecA
VTSVATEGLVGWCNTHFPIALKQEELAGKSADELAKMITDRVRTAYGVKESVEVPEALASIERYVIINAIDHHWQEHLTEMEELRRSIGLRSYGQKDPLVEYKGEAYKYFEELMQNVRLQICTGLFRSASNLQVFENMLAMLSRNALQEGPETDGAAVKAPAAKAPAAKTPTAKTATDKKEIELPKVRAQPAAGFSGVGRNDPCPCGSGKKFKNCHGA